MNRLKAFCVTADDRKRMAEVAEHYALNESAALRMLIKREHDAIARGKV